MPITWWYIVHINATIAAIMWMCNHASFLSLYLLFFHQFFCLNIFKILYPWIFVTHNVLYVLLLLLQTRCGYRLMNQTANWMPQLPGADLKGRGCNIFLSCILLNFHSVWREWGLWSDAILWPLVSESSVYTNDVHLQNLICPICLNDS